MLTAHISVHLVFDANIYIRFIFQTIMEVNMKTILRYAIVVVGALAGRLAC